MAAAYQIKVRQYGSSGAYTDLTPYLAFGGLKWSMQSIDAAGSGRDTQDGLMHRALIAYKVRLDCTCKPLEVTDASTVLTAIKPEWLEVVYFDPQTGSSQTKKMYSNNIPATFCIQHGTNQYWTGITFPLIEQ